MWLCLDENNRVFGFSNENMQGNSGWVWWNGDRLPDNYPDYCLENGRLVYRPLPDPEPEEEPVKAEDLLNILLGGE